MLKIRRVSDQAFGLFSGTVRHCVLFLQHCPALVTLRKKAMDSWIRFVQLLFKVHVACSAVRCSGAGGK